VGIDKSKKFGIMQRQERELTMRMVEIITSDCCGDEVRGLDFCACCLEHCTPILEYLPDPTDCDPAPISGG
jgi:hypothetical protein